jgi:hypothetical protein
MIRLSKCVVVLGAHRSGTSACAGVLHHLGVNMGTRLLPANEKNPKGFFEDLDFSDLHHSMIGEWYKPTDKITPVLIESYSKLIEKKSKHAIWGIKDPKLCMVMEDFAEVAKKFNLLSVINVSRPMDSIINSVMSTSFGKNVILVGVDDDKRKIFRDINYDDAKTITTTYLQSKNSFLDSYDGKRLDIDYDSMIANSEKAVRAIASFIQRKVTQAALDFVDVGLRHYSKPKHF